MRPFGTSLPSVTQLDQRWCPGWCEYMRQSRRLFSGLRILRLSKVAPLAAVLLEVLQIFDQIAARSPNRGKTNKDVPNCTSHIRMRARRHNRRLIAGRRARCR